MDTSQDPFISTAHGRRYYFTRGEFGPLPTGRTDADLRRAMCCAAGRLNRWGGWTDGVSLSVGRHSLLVAAFALARCEAHGFASEFTDLAVREAALHDMKETLGVGDILSPVWAWLRSQNADHELTRIVDLADDAVHMLFDLRLGPWANDVRGVVKAADRDAAAVERAIGFLDAPEWLGHRQALAEATLPIVGLVGDLELAGARLQRIAEGGTLGLLQALAPTVGDNLASLIGLDTEAGRARLVRLAQGRRDP